MCDQDREPGGWLVLAWSAASRGDFQLADEYLSEHVPREETKGTEAAHLWHQIKAADIARFAGHREESHELFRQAIATSDSARAYLLASVARLHLALSLTEAGQLQPARKLFAELLLAYVDHGESRFVAHGLEGLAITELGLGDERVRTRDLSAAAERVRWLLGCPREPDMQALLYSGGLAARSSVEGQDHPEFRGIDEAVAFGLSET